MKMYKFQDIIWTKLEQIEFEQVHEQLKLNKFRTCSWTCSNTICVSSVHGTVLGFHEKHQVKKKNGNFFPEGRDTKTWMEEGEEGTEIPPEVLEQTAAPSESVDGTDKDTGRQEDSDEGTNGDLEDQLGNSSQLGTCKITTGCV
jgi:hypothetical protein